MFPVAFQPSLIPISWIALCYPVDTLRYQSLSAIRFQYSLSIRNTNLIIYTFIPLPEDFYDGRTGAAKCKEDQRKDLLEKWQIRGLSLMMMSETPEDFHDLVKQNLATYGMVKLDQGGELSVTGGSNLEMNLLNIRSFLPLLTIWMTNW